MASPSTGRVTIDYRFVPAPHELILDPHISPPALRLWCVLAYLDWTHEPPSLPILQSHMQQADGSPPTRRSIYRWLSDLESRGWLDWTRAPGKAGINDRITLKTRAQPVTIGSQVRKPVTPESQPVIVGSQVVTLRSQVDYFQALLEPQDLPPQIYSDHVRSSPTPEQPKTGGDGDDFYLELRKRKVGQVKARQIASMGCDPARILALIDNRPNASDPNSLGRLIIDILDGVAFEQSRAVAQPLTATRANLPETTVAPAEVLRQLRERR
jgi:hypothetical protein